MKVEVTRRSFLRGGLGVMGSAALPSWMRGASATPDRLVIGSGEHTYEVQHDWLKLPSRLQYGDTQGLAADKQGRIYVAHTVHPTSVAAEAIAVFSPDGKFLNAWGTAFHGGAHGLDIREENGQEFLYHCDTRRRLVVKTDLEGRTVWQFGMPTQEAAYKNESQWCPTNVAFAPDGDFFVGDGYGSSYVMRFGADGAYKETVIRPGSAAGQVREPHGLWVDSRSGTPKLVVCDRGNRRLQEFTLDGKHLGFVQTGIRRPCHYHTKGDLVLVPDLESVVTILDRDNKVVAQLGDGHPSGLRDAPRSQYVAGKFIHPHAAIWVNSRDIAVAEWVPTGRITRLRKVS